jgi:peptidoglycan hydrolase CwlO-like protein
MSAEPANPILAFLAQMDEKLEHLAIGIGEITRRVSSVEAKVVLLQANFAAQAERIDEIKRRLERIESQLDKVNA